jgi:hypothetical protein
MWAQGEAAGRCSLCRGPIFFLLLQDNLVHIIWHPRCGKRGLRCPTRDEKDRLTESRREEGDQEGRQQQEESRSAAVALMLLFQEQAHPDRGL